GRGTAYRRAGVEAITFTVEATSVLPIPTAAWLPDEGADAADALKGERSVHLADGGVPEPVAVYDAERLQPGNELAGPALVEADDTTVLVHPGQRLWVDGLLNLRIETACAPRPSASSCSPTSRWRRSSRSPATPRSSATATSGSRTTGCRRTSSSCWQRSRSRPRS